MAVVGAVVIGAGPAGLACASRLKAVGVDVTVVEKASQVGSSWRAHYDRLRLHTDRGHSALPGLPMPRDWPRYPARAQVVSYLESYAERFGIAPTFSTTVRTVRRQGDAWEVDCGTTRLLTRAVVVATGVAWAPYRPAWPGLESFGGSVLHSSEYWNPAPFVGGKVLVVGFGNSGGEIALDLAEAGVATSLAVRGPVQVLPRDLFGLPILTWALLYRRLPARLVDAVNAPVIRLALGRVEDIGLCLAAKGPRRMVE